MNGQHNKKEGILFRHLLFIFRVEEKMYSLNNGYPNGSSSSPPSLGPSVPPVFPLLPLPSV